MRWICCLSCVLPLSWWSAAGTGPTDSRALSSGSGRWEWPAATKARLELFNSYGVPQISESTSAPGEIVLMASGSRVNTPSFRGPPVLYSHLAIGASGGFGSNHLSPTLKLTDAVNGSCASDDMDIPAGVAARWEHNGAYVLTPGDMGVAKGPLSLTLHGRRRRRVPPYSDGPGAPAADEAKLVFMWGGIFRFCYSKDGTFTGEAGRSGLLSSPSIRIYGVRSPCSGQLGSPVLADGCLERERWDCWFAFEAEGSVANCAFDLRSGRGRPGWSVESGRRSLMTWSRPFQADTVDSEGHSFATDQHPEFCGVHKPGTEPNLEHAIGEEMLEVDSNQVAVLPLVRAAQLEALSFAACYCPSFDEDKGVPCPGSMGEHDAQACCEKHTEYIQHVGVVYLWTTRVCSVDDFDGVAGCSKQYRRISPQQQVILRISCPPGEGCKQDDENRIKIIDASAGASQPNWSPQHPCRTVSTEPASVMWPLENESMALSGGTRADFKLWSERPVRFNATFEQEFDICFSNTGLPGDFFKVGHVKIASVLAFASAYTDTKIIPTIQYVGVPGGFTLLGGVQNIEPSPYDSTPFSRSARVYLMSYDREAAWGRDDAMTLERYHKFDIDMPEDYAAQMNHACRQYMPYEDLLTPEGNASNSTAEEVQQAVVTNPLPLAHVAFQSNTSTASEFHTFLGPGLDLESVPSLAGTAAVCYCAMLTSEEECSDNGNWLFIGRLLIHGPQGGQTWVLPIGIVTKIAVLGWGLGADGRLRLIPATSTCSDNGGRPATALGYKTGCPRELGLGCKFAFEDTEIHMVPLTGEETNTTIELVSLHATHSVFELPATPRRRRGIVDQLVKDDVITISYDSILTNGREDVHLSPWERLATSRLSGEYVFQDTNILPAVQKKRLVGHRISEVSGDRLEGEPQFLKIPMGWPDAGVSTSLLVSDVVAAGVLEFTFPSGGAWTRHNLVETAEEIRGEVATEGPPLKVCWGSVDAEQGEEGYTTPVSMQAGELTFVDAPHMAHSTVYFSTKQARAIGPAIIAFQTGAHVPAYATVPGKTKLLLRFIDSDLKFGGKLKPFFSDDVQPSCPEYGGCPDFPGDEESVPYTEAQQFLCGKLFTELWSEHAEGFPVPFGCYYSRKWRDQAFVTFEILQNTNCDGGYLRHWNGIESADQCEALCAAEGDCKVWRYCYAETGCSEGAKTCWQMDGTVVSCMRANLGKGQGRIVGLRGDAGPSGGLYPFVQEVTMVFAEHNGLRENTKYMIGMNTDPLAELSVGDALVDLFTLCAEEAGCPRPYMVFERATALASRDLFPKGGHLDPALSAPPGKDGFVIQAPGDSDVVNFAESNILQVKLTGDGGRVIKPRAILRVYMWPLTQWNLGPGDCTAECISYHLSSTKECKGFVGCGSERFIDHTFYDSYNVLKLQLPSHMDDISGSVWHTVKVESLNLPPTGFFPGRVGVQLTKEDEKAPQFLTSSGFVWKFAQKGLHETRLVLTARTGYGPRPFVNDMANSLILRLQFASTLWARAGGSEEANFIKITLPEGYRSCDVIEGGILDSTRDGIDSTLDVFHVDVNQDGYRDNRFGILSADPLDGTWSIWNKSAVNSSNVTCVYTLGSYSRLHANQVVYFEVTVDNPEEVLLKNDPRNVWRLQYASEGDAPTGDGYRTPDYDFISNSRVPDLPGGTELWSGNAAVITPLAHDIIQPGQSRDSLSRSCCGAELQPRRVQQWLRVFFKPNLPIDPGGDVIVDAPDGFDFGSTCEVRDLSDEYYAFYGEFEYLLNRITPPLECDVAQYPPVSINHPAASTNNTIRVKVADWLKVTELDQFGFEVYVTHPAEYDVSQHEGWRIWTEDSMGRSLEGSQEPARLSVFHPRPGGPFYRKSWGMYNEAASDIEVMVESLEPNRISPVAVHSLGPFEEALNTSLRIIAPFGYEWMDNMDTFYITMDCNYSSGYLCGVASNQTGVPLPFFDSTAPNELVWPQVTFEADVQYGFEQLALLPWHSPRTSSNAFFVELGYRESSIEGRLQAVAIEAPRVATTTTTTTSSTSATTTTSTTTISSTTSLTTTTTTTTTMPRQPVCATQFLNASTAWAVRGAVLQKSPEDGGMLMNTDNGGSEWFRATTGDPRFFGLHFLDTLNGWAVGQSGTIWHTHDGGSNWVTQPSGVSINLLGVHFVAEGHGERIQEGRSGRQQTNQVVVGWAVGDLGTILKYTEEEQWMPEVSGTSHTLVAAHFVNATHGWVVGDQGVILMTDSGGEQWMPQASGTSEYLYRVRFEDEATGWVLGGFGTMLMTTDGGNSWNEWG